MQGQLTQAPSQAQTHPLLQAMGKSDDTQTTAQLNPAGTLSLQQQGVLSNLRKPFEEMKQTEARIKALETAAAKATSQGNLQLVEQIKREREKQVIAQGKLKNMIGAAFASMQLGPAGHQAFSQLWAQSTPGDPHTTKSGSSGDMGAIAGSGPHAQVSNLALNHMQTSPPQNSPMNYNNVIGIPVQAVNPTDSQQTSTAPLAQVSNLSMTQSPNNSSTTSQGYPRLPVPSTPQMAAQMQKLMDQRGNRLSGPFLGQHPDTGQSELPASNIITVWQGVLTWAGFDAATQGKKEVHAQVSASVQLGTERER